MSYLPRLKGEYKERITVALQSEFAYKNVMEIPKLLKIAVLVVRLRIRS
jgi:large subunit ribosomal protein L5